MLESGKGNGKPFFGPLSFMNLSLGMAPRPPLDGPYVGDALPTAGPPDWSGGWGGPAKGKGGGAKAGGAGKDNGGDGKWWQSGWKNQGWKSWESWDDVWEEEDAYKGSAKGKGGAFKGASGKGAAADAGKKGGGCKGEQRPKGKGEPVPPAPAKGGGKKSGHDPVKEEVLAEIEAVLADANTKLRPDDFDFRVRRYLLALRSSQGSEKVKDALAMIQTFTSHKSRDSVKNWPAYVLALLKKFEPDPFTKGKGRGSGGQASGDAPAPAKVPPSAKPAAPAAAAARRPEKAPGAAAEEAAPPEEGAAAAARAPASLPQGWIAGRKVLLEEIQGVLAPGGDLRCPFTQEPLDCQATLVSQLAACLRPGNLGDQCRHAAGVARARELVECPRAAALGTVAGQPELTALPEDASAMDASEAAAALAQAHPDCGDLAEAMLQEVGLELAAEVLRTQRLSAVGPP